ncbi:MAG: histidine phosphatase family protein [Myxococcales bacterium]|nr:histidine phosphatase family protein [Myxococcales bacterium]MDD9965741.1 histidine phosphatase family protein [Myxococcales bacterium]
MNTLGTGHTRLGCDGTVAPPLRLHLIRHGKAMSSRVLSRVSDPSVADGQSELDPAKISADYDALHPVGCEQARRLGAHLAKAGHTFERVVCGPMQRHQSTLEHMRLGAGLHACHWPEAVTIETTREVAFEVLVSRHLASTIHTLPGAAEAKAAEATRQGAQHETTTSLVANLIMAWQRGEIDAEGVESPEAFRTRSRAALSEITSLVGSGDVAVITSLGVINEMLAAAAPSTGAAFRWLNNASVSRIRLQEGRYEIECVGDTSHLAGEAGLATLI